MAAAAESLTLARQASAASRANLFARRPVLGHGRWQPAAAAPAHVVGADPARATRPPSPPRLGASPLPHPLRPPPQHAPVYASGPSSRHMPDPLLRLRSSPPPRPRSLPLEPDQQRSSLRLSPDHRGSPPYPRSSPRVHSLRRARVSFAEHDSPLLSPSRPLASPPLAPPPRAAVALALSDLDVPAPALARTGAPSSIFPPRHRLMTDDARASSVPLMDWNGDAPPTLAGDGGLRELTSYEREVRASTVSPPQVDVAPLQMELSGLGVGHAPTLSTWASPVSSAAPAEATPEPLGLADYSPPARIELAPVRGSASPSTHSKASTFALSPARVAEVAASPLPSLSALAMATSLDEWSSLEPELEPTSEEREIAAASEAETLFVDAVAEPEPAPLPAAEPEPFAPNTRALFDFADLNPMHLDFVEGEPLHVLDDSGKWWIARNTHGSEGLVPSNYPAAVTQAVAAVSPTSAANSADVESSAVDAADASVDALAETGASGDDATELEDEFYIESEVEAAAPAAVATAADATGAEAEAAAEVEADIHTRSRAASETAPTAPKVPKRTSRYTKDDAIMLVQALCGYADPSVHRLDFEAGEVLYVLEQSSNWWHAMNEDGAEGLIPSNFVLECPAPPVVTDPPGPTTPNSPDTVQEAAELLEAAPAPPVFSLSDADDIHVLDIDAFDLSNFQAPPPPQASLEQLDASAPELAAHASGDAPPPPDVAVAEMRVPHETEPELKAEAEAKVEAEPEPKAEAEAKVEAEPEPKPKPKEPRYVQALHRFEDDNPRRLDFEAGEILEVLQARGNWWEARTVLGDIGLLPSNFVQIIDAADGARLFHAQVRGSESDTESAVVDDAVADLLESGGEDDAAHSLNDSGAMFQEIVAAPDEELEAPAGVESSAMVFSDEDSVSTVAEDEADPAVVEPVAADAAVHAATVELATSSDDDSADVEASAPAVAEDEADPAVVEPVVVASASDDDSASTVAEDEAESAVVEPVVADAAVDDDSASTVAEDEADPAVVEPVVVASASDDDSATTVTEDEADPAVVESVVVASASDNVSASTVAEDTAESAVVEPVVADAAVHAVTAELATSSDDDSASTVAEDEADVAVVEPVVAVAAVPVAVESATSSDDNSASTVAEDEDDPAVVEPVVVASASDDDSASTVAEDEAESAVVEPVVADAAVHAVTAELATSSDDDSASTVAEDEADVAVVEPVVAVAAVPVAVEPATSSDVEDSAPAVAEDEADPAVVEPVVGTPLCMHDDDSAPAVAENETAIAVVVPAATIEPATSSDSDSASTDSEDEADPAVVEPVVVASTSDNDSAPAVAENETAAAVVVPTAAVEPASSSDDDSVSTDSEDEAAAAAEPAVVPVVATGSATSSDDDSASTFAVDTADPAVVEPVVAEAAVATTQPVTNSDNNDLPSSAAEASENGTAVDDGVAHSPTYASASHDFSDPNPRRLDFAKGTIFRIHVTEGNWWDASTPNGARGLVPSNYLEEIDQADGAAAFATPRPLSNTDELAADAIALVAELDSLWPSDDDEAEVAAKAATPAHETQVPPHKAAELIQLDSTTEDPPSPSALNRSISFADNNEYFEYPRPFSYTTESDSNSGSGFSDSSSSSSSSPSSSSEPEDFSRFNHISDADLDASIATLKDDIAKAKAAGADLDLVDDLYDEYMARRRARAARS
ncbi:uncharacterized protein AMSG_12063 [Thecamonas trahens ATCC 50062]|uniref:SH3 domain-containing protein n=1 Tax=Thecamonas trahens ATCC 50062 TaxID=461836 RepID=A0A0L0DGP0_THETB|nr:hypothetical protein AMSG_12063 [Thecamonas trahens ATCC 50062]KNC51286.1 hypothetical protein AMSG_12063 [Thecamonas trahens ATCC 50062]|eukprot:XP_013756302.1 hypothetical protein AMSG_12063 [Thecamonas trahens ATCC 50062]